MSVLSDQRLARTGTPEHDPVWKDAQWRARLRRPLLRWFNRNARDLPWRREPTPYGVWISEIMLQQTQVATVLPYYQRFMRCFPTVEALANADEQTLLGHWEGLGYYRRARLMHAAARQIMEVHGGKFPESFEQVLALPGIGRYTAGAILSISQDQRLPVLEGNTVRVFSRWIALRTPVNQSASKELLWQLAEAMLPRKGSASFNQAAMELGALLCTPKSPQCGLCPVKNLCRARQTNLQHEIPGKVTSIQYEDRAEYAFVVRQRSDSVVAESDPGSILRTGYLPAARFLVRPLPAGARWAGMWDFPRATERSFDSVDQAADQLGQQIGAAMEPAAHLTTLKHAVTKYRISLHVHWGHVHWGQVDHGRSDPPPPPPWKYLTLQELADLPMSATGRRIVNLLQSQPAA